MTRRFPQPGIARTLRAAAFLVLGLLAGCQTAELSPAGLGVATLSDASQAQVRGRSILVMDYQSGRILRQEAPDGLRYPASLTKMMTLYLVFEAVDAGKLSLDDRLRVSEYASSKPPVKIGLKPGETIAVRDAAQAIAIKSANDVAAVIAENLAGSEPAFAAVMTAKAKSLGMRNTRFVNASGLPDPRQISTARDMAILGRSLLSRFPEYAPLFRSTEFNYNGRTYHATNKLLGKVRGVDGLKTGYIRDAGFHLVATATRNGRRLIVVVMGGRTGRERNAEVTALIEEYLGG
ncbi:D-alanyl-D-alanine carboxypeptidase family protein [Jiella marina]|uniref:D-alanyl-D-alanine carboxypeptidase family protein n=1 Tax=Jiella sp. LLJ827 TaxID=2917712 RepID=UPI002100938E|nr:D-alanyl-D-alanine carboxypeptidase family protein [Jiella sp. LLJ827]MCQ0988640.1 D-alanyl-D-alanine carboxypeptidase [Jiella sp. LLJ827]